MQRAMAVCGRHAAEIHPQASRLHLRQPDAEFLGGPERELGN